MENEITIEKVIEELTEYSYDSLMTVGINLGRLLSDEDVACLLNGIVIGRTAFDQEDRTTPVLLDDVATLIHDLGSTDMSQTEVAGD